MFDLIPAKEAAIILGLKYPTLMARIKRQKITGHKIGWAVFVSTAEIERIQNARRKDLEKPAG